MFDLGDEFILDNYRVPWLIWIQILVMFLLTLIILLSYFGFFVVDSSTTCNSVSDFSSSLVTPSGCSPSTQEAGSRGSRREIANTASNRARRLENTSERDGSSTKDLAPSNAGTRFFHPCRYFDFAKQAFLKCLGLSSGPHNFPDKEDEQED